MPIEDQNLPLVLYALVLSLWYILQSKDQFILNDRDVIPETFRERQWICVDILYIGSSSINFQYISLLLPNIYLIIASHHHYLILSDLDSRIGCIRGEFISVALKNRTNYGPFSLFLIIDLDNVGDRVIIGNATKLIDIPAIERTTSERTCLIDHRFYLLYFVTDNIKSLATIGNDLIIQDTYH